MDIVSWLPLVFLIALLAGANIFFRRRLFRSYRKLVDSDIQFELSHVLDQRKMVAEIYPYYSDQEIAYIDEFVGQIRQGLIFFGVILLLMVAGVYFYFN